MNWNANRADLETQYWKHEGGRYHVYYSLSIFWPYESEQKVVESIKKEEKQRKINQSNFYFKPNVQKGQNIKYNKIHTKSQVHRTTNGL